MADLPTHAEMRRIGDILKKELPEGIGFTLVVNKNNAAGMTPYISTNNRADMIKLFRELATHFETTMN